MLTIYCKLCPTELSAPGALVFSPPDEEDVTTKYHVCEECWRLYLRPLLEGLELLADG